MKQIIKQATYRARIAVLALLITSGSAALHAQVGTPVPHSIDHEAQLTGAHATYTTAKGYFKFALVNGTGATVKAWWKNDKNVPPFTIAAPVGSVPLPVSAGGYGLFLGSAPATVGIPYDVFSQPDLRVRTWFSPTISGPFVLQQPDVPIPAVGYAMHVPDGSITKAKLAPGSVESAQIAANAVASAQIAKGAVSLGKVGTGAITVGNLLTPLGLPVSGQVLGFNGTNFTWMPPGAGIWALNGTNAYYTAGNIGIGTATPQAGYRLHVAGHALISMNGDEVLFGTPNSETGMTITRAARFSLTAGNIPAARADVRFDGSTLKLLAGTGLGAMPSTNGIAIASSGKVGIGTTKPAHRLAIIGGPAWTSNGWTGSVELANGSAIGWGENTFGKRCGIGHSNSGFYIFRTESDPGTVGTSADYDFFINDVGDVGIGTLHPRDRLEVNGTIRTKVLKIEGADVAEPFDIAEPGLPKGTVVAIDTTRHGGLKRSTREYDTRVAGIVSGANGVNSGIILSQPGVNEGGQNVAISGRVYVHADASSAPIEPGDLLTTSALPGHAMKVTDHARAQGAVIGKAMSSLDEGTGMVLVLVTLQ